MERRFLNMFYIFRLIEELKRNGNRFLTSLEVTRFEKGGFAKAIFLDQFEMISFGMKDVEKLIGAKTAELREYSRRRTKRTFD